MDKNNPVLNSALQNPSKLTTKPTYFVAFLLKPRKSNGMTAGGHTPRFRRSDTTFAYVRHHSDNFAIQLTGPRCERERALILTLTLEKDRRAAHRLAPPFISF
ncbi:unnamed protein product [Parnassius apollo]|uniref:(apollo) hypothetical protein n=1 Tax=Parnassius apollo TaxID=110799 RepID=A0A8S3X191_PARAO|nr:unnamed protein product [Parnassius apollo]